MQDPKLVAYYRVSTKRQARASGLGLEAQNTAVETYARATAGRIIKSFTEVERTADKTASHLECCSGVRADGITRAAFCGSSPSTRPPCVGQSSIQSRNCLGLGPPHRLLSWSNGRTRVRPMAIRSTSSRVIDSLVRSSSFVIVWKWA